MDPELEKEMADVKRLVDEFNKRQVVRDPESHQLRRREEFEQNAQAAMWPVNRRIDYWKAVGYPEQSRQRVLIDDVLRPQPTPTAAPTPTGMMPAANYPVEITEDMSPQERHFALNEGPHVLRGLQLAGQFGSGGALAALQRPAFGDQALRALDYLATLAATIPPGLQSGLALRAGLLPATRAAAPAAGPVARQAASTAQLSQSKNRLAALEMLIRRAHEQASFQPKIPMRFRE